MDTIEEKVVRRCPELRRLAAIGDNADVENLPDSTDPQNLQPPLPWRVAILSDPHGDLVALRKVVDHLYGHIHMQYVHSVGAVNGSNDADSRPAYVIVNLAETVRIEPRRVDWPAQERLAAYRVAGVEKRFSRHVPGPFPCRCEPGTAVTVWPRT